LAATAPAVTIAIVTFNSARYIRPCLEFALAQNYSNFEIIVIDNDSRDGTRAALKKFEDRVRIICNSENFGFAAAQNQAIRVSRAPWVLTLNPDVRLSPDFIARLVEAGSLDPRCGAVTGKLLAMAPDFEIPAQPVFDSTGIYFTPSLRHFDRGSRMPDDGRYNQLEYVFGATGAAALYRREMIDDISINGEFFDPDFFAYREDADVAWRAQLLGWRCVYTPGAVAWHVRSVLPSNRRSLPAAVNMHSVKNRWLMRIKNMTPDLYRRHGFAITFRDCVVIAGCLLFEFRSLRAFALLFRLFPRAWARRREIMARRRVSGPAIAKWFAPQPVSEPFHLSAIRDNQV
jgi:GT2 family glycosyltransferase